MSAKNDESVNCDFASRLKEICKTDQPAELADKLQISYQAARNYLKGRLPETKVLLMISEKTDYSVHWLLTGKGKKFVTKTEDLNTLLLSDQLKEFVRQECVEIINELLVSEKDSTSPQIETADKTSVKLTTETVRREIDEKKPKVRRKPKSD